MAIRALNNSLHQDFFSDASSVVDLRDFLSFFLKDAPNSFNFSSSGDSFPFIASSMIFGMLISQRFFSPSLRSLLVSYPIANLSFSSIISPKSFGTPDSAESVDLSGFFMSCTATVLVDTSVRAFSRSSFVFGWVGSS